jgi:tetratricopeptide (TPR) repeat protein
LGEKRAWAIALGDIAELLAAKGEADQALKLHQEELVIYEALDDKRSRAVTLSQIAGLLAAKGEVDQALKLHQEQLVIYEALDDQDSIAQTLWSIAQIELRQQHFGQAFEHLAASYDITLKLGRLDAICYVGQDFGQVLCARGDTEKGLAVLERSRDGFVKLARPENARNV